MAIDAEYFVQRVKKYFVQVNQHYLLARDNVCSALKSCYEAVAASRKYHVSSRFGISRLNLGAFVYLQHL